MIKFKKGKPRQPVVRADLIAECLRLRKVVQLAVMELDRLCPPAADMVRIALARDEEHEQPDVGWGRGTDQRKGAFYDDPENAGKEMP